MKALVAALVLGGFGWRQVDSGKTESLWSVTTLDEVTAVAVGEHGTILRSNDGGESWTATPCEPGWRLNAVSFADNVYGSAVGYDSSTQRGLLLRTEDGGLHWWPQEGGPDYTGLAGVHLFDACTGVAVGDRAVILRTEDCGESWRTQLSALPAMLWSVHFTDAWAGTAVGWWYGDLSYRSYILTTVDAGQTWQEAGLDPRWIRAGLGSGASRTPTRITALL